MSHKLKLLSCLPLLLHTPEIAHAEQWYESAGNKWAHVSQVACDVATSGITKWFTKDGPYQFGGSPANAKLYAIMKRSVVDTILQGKNIGYQQIELHSLSNKDGMTLAKEYSKVADAGVPFYLQILPLPAQIGTSLSLIDWALKNSASRGNASELAALMPSGGELENGFSIAKQGDRVWLVRQIYYNVSVNKQMRHYIICSWQYPVSIVN